MRRTHFATLFLALLLVLLPAALAAQDASPAASPTMGECVAPEIPEGTPTPMEEETGPPEMAATPEDGAEGSPAADMAMVMPPMPEPLTGEPGTDDDLAEAEAATMNAAACLNAGMWLEFGALHTANGRMENCGSENIYDTEMCMAGVPEVQILEVTNPQILDDGRLGVDVSYRIGNNLAAEQFVFVREGDWLLLDTMPDLPIPVPEGATEIEVELLDYAFEMSANSAPAGDIAFFLTNTGEEPHEFVVVALPEGVTADDLLSEDAPWEEIQFFGGGLAMPGQGEVTMALLDMEPGTYTVVCFIPDAEGVPHIAHGMVAEFVVTEP